MSTTIEFPHTFVINLDERQDRWAHISQVCDAAGIQIERVAATKATPGWVGCGKSHLECLRRAAQRGLPWVLVLEDDALFTPADIDRFRALLPHLWAKRNSWDIFNGGPALTSSKPEPKILDKESKLVLIQALTTHFMLYQNHVFASVKQWNLLLDGAIDVFFYQQGFGDNANIRTVVTTPGIATQLVDKSSIYGTTNNQTGAFRFANQRLLEFLHEPDWMGDVRTCETLNVVHRYWRSQILLERHGTAGLLPLAQSRADYSKATGVLVMRWHYHPTEIFLELGGEFVLAGYLTEYLNETSSVAEAERASLYEITHPMWSDRICLLHELQRAVKLSDGTAGSYTKNGALLGIEWDIYPREFFLLQGEQYEFAGSNIQNESEFLLNLRQTNTRNIGTGAARKNIVVVRAGDRSLHSLWPKNIEEYSRSWDLCISFYGNDPSIMSSEHEFFYSEKGNKWDPIYKLYERGFFSPYEYAFFPDDDIMMSWEQINQLFETMRKFDLEIAQPSLSPHSPHGLEITLHRPGSMIRYTSIVEMMLPAFSANALAACAHTFPGHKSAWGIDFAWTEILGRPSNKIAIIDNIVVEHTRPVAQNYDSAAAMSEMAATLNLYGAKWECTEFSRIALEQP